MTDAFTLQIPVEPSYRALGSEVASRYAELSGGSAADGAALAAALTGAIDRLVAGAGTGARLDLSFQPDSAGVHVELACNGHRETVKVTIPIGKT